MLWRGAQHARQADHTAISKLRSSKLVQYCGDAAQVESESARQRQAEENALLYATQAG